MSASPTANGSSAVAETKVGTGIGTGVVAGASGDIVFDDVSRFYGEVLGVNRVNLVLEPGIISLVGPNGSGKTTLMNLITGLLHPTRGTVTVLGLTADQPEQLFRKVGYCSQFDSFPKGLSGHQLIYSYLRVHGYNHGDADARSWRALERVGLQEAAHRRAAAYSKGMRQRLRLAQAMSHDPQILVLDEPLNGLDPMARAEVIDVFQQLRDEGRHVFISSHILHEVDVISDRVVLLNSGYVVAEGEIQGVRDEMEEEHPAQVVVRCDRPSALAARLFREEMVVEAQVHQDGAGVLVRTRNADSFHLLLNRVVVEDGLSIESVVPADADVNAVYQYLIGNDGEAR